MIEISKNLKLEKTNEVTAQNFWDESTGGPLSLLILIFLKYSMKMN